jgi:hypothetical protein
MKQVIIDFYNHDHFDFWMILIASLVILFIVGVVIFNWLDELRIKGLPRSAVIKDKKYKAESTHRGTGYGIGTNGQAMLISTSSTDDEDWLLIVKDEFNIYHTIEVAPSVYYEKRIGDNLNILVYTGRFSGAIVRVEINE